MLAFWVLPRRSYEFFARLCRLYPTPPLADHLEFILFLIPIYGIVFPQFHHHPHKFVLLTSVLGLHFLKGIRWQLYLLYIYLFLDLFFPQFTFNHLISISILVLSIVICIIFPMVPPLLSHTHQPIGIQDICLQGDQTKFWVRFYYPSALPSWNLFQETKTFLYNSIYEFLFMFLIFQFYSLTSSSSLALPPALPLALPLVPSAPSPPHIVLLFWSLHFLMKYFEKVISQIKQVNYLPDHLASHGMARYSKLPQILFSHLDLFTICGYTDSSLLDTISLKIAFVLHGLSGCRSTYTSICLSLVSQGYLVISPEFGDSTPASSLLPDGTIRYYEHYLGSLDSQEYHDFRQKQLQQRVHEMNIILSFLQTVRGHRSSSSSTAAAAAAAATSASSDEQMNQFQPHIRWKSNLSSSTSPPSVIDSSLFLKSLQSNSLQVEFKNPLIVGHSFGGATAIYLASNTTSTECQLFRQRYGLGGLVLYDPWMFPLGETLRKGEETIHFYQSASPTSVNDDDTRMVTHETGLHHTSIPILCLHAEKFQWKANLEFENQVVRVSSSSASPLPPESTPSPPSTRSFIYQIRLEDAGHMNYTEVSLLAPHVMSRMKSIGKQNPDDLLADINDLTVNFIKMIGHHRQRCVRGNNEITYSQQKTDIDTSEKEEFEKKLFEKKQKFTILFSQSP
jgi:dienelactone hydrolase